VLYHGDRGVDLGSRPTACAGAGALTLSGAPMTRRRWLLAVPAALVVAQAVPVERTNPPAEAMVPAPPEVMAILRRACWDCHSRETVWGWHTRIAPISWLVAHDVNEGRRELDFSAWGTGRHRERVGRKIAEEVREGEMPPWLYRLAHPAARLSDADRAVLVGWAATLK
jgi:hypothetical protein